MRNKPSCLLDALQNVDYIKVDWCGYGPEGTKVARGNQCGPNVTEDSCKETRFTEFSRALNKTGRPIYLAASSAIGTPEWAPKFLNSWRIGGDHHDWWSTNNTGWMWNSSTRFKIDNINRANRALKTGPGACTPSESTFFLPHVHPHFLKRCVE